MRQDSKIIITVVLYCLYLVTWKYFGSPSFFMEVSNRISSPEFLIQYEWFPAFAHFFSTTIFLGLLPLITQKLLWGTWFSSDFFRLPKLNSIIQYFVLPLTLIFMFMSFVAAFDPAFHAQYPFSRMGAKGVENFLFYSLCYALFYYLPWEFFFRGQLQFLIKKHYGFAPALLCQLLASVLVHIGKPSGEIYGSIFAGLYWSYLTEKTGSILLPLVMHILVGVSLDFFILSV